MNSIGQMRVLVAGQHAGRLMRDAGGVLGFAYEQGYGGPDLSVGMPVEGGEFWGRHVHAWFAGLLPDSLDVRRAMAVAAGCGPNSVFGLLGAYGMDLPGAVQVALDEPGGASPRSSGYVESSPSEIRQRLESLVKSERRNETHRWMQPGERWSLGGNQAKIALREFGGSWYSCQGDAASNVIVKPGVSWLGSQALDECICMRLAKMVGLPVADARIASFDGFEAIVVDRYDRITAADGTVVRIHQEDLCQALGVVPEKKYAADGGPTSAAAMNLLAGDATGRGKKMFFDALVFNYLIAATDAHAKNYSLLHTARGSFRMAPLYDIASAAPYMNDRKAYRLAMSIGGENRVGWLRKTSVDRFARAHKLDADALTDRICLLAGRVMANLEPAVDEFSSCAGIDELASLLVPRVRALCRAAERNVRVGSGSFKPVDIARIVPR